MTKKWEQTYHSFGKEFAASQGKSLNKFICDAIEQQMGTKLKDTEND